MAHGAASTEHPSILLLLADAWRATAFSAAPRSDVLAETPHLDALRASAVDFAAAYASYPLDTVRRRLQADARRPPGERRYKGSLDCLTKIYRVEGVGALFKGAGYNALRTITAALSLVVYGEATKKKKRR